MPPQDLRCFLSFLFSAVTLWACLFLLGYTIEGGCKAGLCKDVGSVVPLGILSFSLIFYFAYGYLQWFYCSAAKEYLTCINVVQLLRD